MPRTITNPDNSLATCLRLLLIRLTEWQIVQADRAEAQRHYWGLSCGLPQGRN